MKNYLMASYFSSFQQKLCHDNRSKYNFNQSNITASSTSWVTNDEASINQSPPEEAYHQQKSL